jgi:putative ABC transport system permease protein
VQGALVVSELALSLALVVAAGLLINSFARLSATDPGFRTRDLLRMKVSFAGQQYASPTIRLERTSTLMQGVRRLPGVVAAGTVTRFPLHDGNITTSVAVEGKPNPGSGQLPDADLRMAGGDYFKAMGIRLIAGRFLTDNERIDSGAVPVAVINQTMALQLFGEPAPVGKRMQLGGHANAPFFEVVGVVADIRDASLRDAPRPQVFQSAAQGAPRTMSIVIHHTGESGAVLSGVRSLLRDIDPALPVFDVQQVGDVLGAASVNDRFSTMLLSTFSGLALLLAAIGTYGVIAFGVNERTHDIGVRMALGAPRSSVLKMVLGEGMWLLAIALPLGLAVAWMSTRFLQTLLFGVSAFDVSTTVTAALVLAGAALAACYIPARRAANVDPLQAIRSE